MTIPSSPQRHPIWNINRICIYIHIATHTLWRDIRIPRGRHTKNFIHKTSLSDDRWRHVSQLRFTHTSIHIHIFILTHTYAFDCTHTKAIIIMHYFVCVMPLFFISGHEQIQYSMYILVNSILIFRTIISILYYCYYLSDHHST